ncbi:hypothetical protein [Thalassospira alkalitolerans]|uniref:MFS transporter permease n=1 Tax=Thalassospira alkalitolerans TaxID=1293890 RepID=A0A1Y2L5E9_9PROT|nr:hypothetical protein [Thalassospira alkalitolerans]OSQ42177.1 hypothetical protein TALK_21740 [Thalassospira alkalitolerans]
MGDWWSYGLADFLLFSPRVYYRLFETLNTTWGLAVAAALIAGMVASGLAMRRGCRGNRVVLILLAMIWGWVTAGFLWQYYQPINWVIPYFIPAFIVEAGFMVMFAVRRMPLRFGWRGDFSSVAGAALLLIAIIGFPFAGLIEGRGMIQAELFGSAADPTAIGTLGFILLARGTWRWLLLPVPLVWCVMASAILWVMDQNIALLPLIAVWLTVLGGWMDQKNGVTRKPVLDTGGAD